MKYKIIKETRADDSVRYRVLKKNLLGNYVVIKSEELTLD